MWVSSWLKTEIYNKFDKNNLSFKGYEYDNDYFINGTIRDFNKEKLRASVTDFEMIFPIKEIIQYYVLLLGNIFLNINQILSMLILNF
jgi:hypothetical protein